MKLSRSIPAIVFILGFGIWIGAAKTSVAKSEPDSVGLLPPIIFVAAPSVVPGELTGRFPQGSHLAHFLPETHASSAQNLTPEFFAAADPQVSFDATHVLFSGQRKRGARWQIWEMNTDGSNQHQLTNCPADCLRPAYLPRGQIVFTMVTRKGSRHRSAIYVSRQNGTDAHPITFGPGNFQVETVLHSGRILVSAESLLVAGNADGDSRVFYTLRPDGSGLSLFRWEDRPHVVRTGAVELEDGTVLFVERQDPGGRQTGGELAWTRPEALHNAVITPPRAACWSAHPLDGNRLIVAKESSASSSGVGAYGLYVLNLATKSFGKAIYRDAKLSSVEAVPVEPQPVPRYYWSVLHPDRDYGRVVCLNAYVSAGAPQGRLKAHIARVRVIALQPDHRHERVLGEAPVESDGSFYIKVPADLPIRFALLSAKGSVIRAQQSWIWARTGEDVPCLGCHEDKALAPENRWPLALKRANVPIPVGVPSQSERAQH